MPIATASARKWIVVLAAAVILSGLPSAAQSRLSDKDVQQLMSNLHNDVKAFRSPFNSALSKSPIHKTSQETDAKNLSKQLEKQTGDMLDTFKKKQKADDAFRSVNSTIQQLDPIVQQLGPQSAAAPSWVKVQGDLSALNPAFGVTQTANAQACTQAVGAQRANELVTQCQQVSTATNSPCNTQNACKTITDEIRRGCKAITSNAPSFCAEYQ